ncbi:sensor histidine kinase [Altericroceibacterium xinjiangense]|uniref:sensor histidine kinase n=1 Tax=Altericroceibacterium xinjiangense TaxID=762261 RepID=UPI000F7ECA47|nr:PAS domain-containing sensor histidine kinase [Altericroceibacterium xinjiangense]
MKPRNNQPAEPQTLALAIIDAMIDPFVVLDDEMQLVTGSRSFYDSFKVDAESARGQSFYDLCGGDWSVPALRKLLEGVTPAHTHVEWLELNVRFSEFGDRILLLNTRVVLPEGQGGPTTLLLIKDVTARRQIEREKQNLLEQTEELLSEQRTLLKEMRHRIANSLQIIASILMLQVRTVTSQETRDHLKDAHQRVMSVAQVQAHLHSVDGIDEIDVRGYLTKLCRGLGASMTGPANPIRIETIASEGTLPSSRAVSLGLIVTELVINSIKYAFPVRTPGACIVVSYETTEEVWRLTVSDNGIGNLHSVSGAGLGAAIVAALAKQLGGQISTVSNGGLTVSLAGVLSEGKLPLAA